MYEVPCYQEDFLHALQDQMIIKWTLVTNLRLHNYKGVSILLIGKLVTITFGEGLNGNLKSRAS